MYKKISARKVAESIARHFELDALKFKRTENPVQYKFEFINNDTDTKYEISVSTFRVYLYFYRYDLLVRDYKFSDASSLGNAGFFETPEQYIDEVIKFIKPYMKMFIAQSRESKIDSIFSDDEVEPANYKMVIPKKEKIKPLIEFAEGDICIRQSRFGTYQYEVVRVTDKQIVICPLIGQGLIQRNYMVNLNEDGNYKNRYGLVTKPLKIDFKF